MSRSNSEEIISVLYLILGIMSLGFGFTFLGVTALIIGSVNLVYAMYLYMKGLR